MTSTVQDGRRRTRRRLAAAALALIVSGCVLAAATWFSLRDFPQGLAVVQAGVVKPQVLARDGTPLNLSLQNRWNVHVVPLHEIPELLQQSFVISEDRHFYTHAGVDWRARGAALWQNLKARAAVRGASTITEQVVRLLHPRPRTVWSRWLEGFEAQRLEARFSKRVLLEFYLNQVPYAERRRGVEAAARFYYDRGLDTLTPQEMLALVVLVRSPNGMDLRRNPQRAKRAIEQLADRLLAQGVLEPAERTALLGAQLELATSRLRIDASHFVTHVLGQGVRSSRPDGAILTTLDVHVQERVQAILDASLTSLAKRKVRDGAVVVIDHARNEVRAWVVGRSMPESAGMGYDTVLTPRQPGSTLKPLLYATAMEQGWTAATLIDDSELSESVRGGMHTFHNYSRNHYGPIRLREALGNSLNIPAVKALKFVGTERFLERLHQVGIGSLREHPDVYGEGLALGNGAVTLYEMAQAYTVLARRGHWLPLTTLADDSTSRPTRTAFTPEVASIITHILADANARALEFGKGLQFPVETAIKTGTSSDYRDAWAIAFDYAHTVAVWMGSLDNAAMDGVTGSIGPAMVARSIFSELNRNRDTQGLWLSRKLTAMTICRKDGRPQYDDCESMTEWFVPGTSPQPASVSAQTAPTFRVLQPTPGMQVARDPRIPDELEALTMTVTQAAGLRRVEWIIDGELRGTTESHKWTWPLEQGSHEVYSRVWSGASKEPQLTPMVRFYVR